MRSHKPFQTTPTLSVVPDASFADRRLAGIYDRLEGDRADLDVYAAMLVDEFGARTVLDIGCGTGTLACLLARRGVEVIGIDPAEASLDVARAKPGAEGVRWITGDAAALPRVQVDAAVMTGNVAQVFLSDEEWERVLAAVRAALGPGGRFVFETRDPERQAWREWDRAHTLARTVIPVVGAVTTWCDVTGVEPPLVSFRGTNVFEADGAVLTSDSTLRFRSRDEIERSLTAAGYVVEEVRDAPDRPGLEFVFIARPCAR
jgi:SAM-dependent methyltransferase